MEKLLDKHMVKLGMSRCIERLRMSFVERSQVHPNFRCRHFRPKNYGRELAGSTVVVLRYVKCDDLRELFNSKFTAFPA